MATFGGSTSIESSVPEGSHPAVCVEVREFTKDEPDYNDKSKTVTNQKIQYVFEVPGHGLVGTKPFNAKWGLKSSHYKFVAAWFGGAAPVPYDSDSVKGKWAKLLVTHNEGQSRTFVDAAKAAPLPEEQIPQGYVPSAQEEEAVTF